MAILYQIWENSFTNLVLYTKTRKRWKNRIPYDESKVRTAHDLLENARDLL